MVSAKDQLAAGPERRMKALRIELPPAPAPFGNYVETLLSGNLLFLTGMLPVVGHEPKFLGRLGKELDAEAGRDAARTAVLSGLAAARQHLGSLDRICRVVRLGVYMATYGDFFDLPHVADGASDLLRDVFGPESLTVRLVIGVASLPLGVPIEVELIFEIDEQAERETRSFSLSTAGLVKASHQPQAHSLCSRVQEVIIGNTTTTGGVMPTAVAATTMKAAQVAGGGKGIQIVEREIPEPGAGQVRIKVHACGVCHSDVLVVEGAWPGLPYPRVPGHEVAGVVEKAGAGVSQWQKGQRVGVGWHGGHDGTCRECRRGDFMNCRNQQIAGISYDGGYQEYMVAPAEALVSIPDSISDVDAAPLLCAGITTYNALRHAGAHPGDVVAVQGIGGLGHLGIQFANKFGYRVVAVSRGPENEHLARKLGASLYIDSKVSKPAEELQKLGGAQVIMATAPNSKAMSELIDGLGPNGKLLVIGATFDPIEVTPIQLIMGSKSLQGWAAGTAADGEDTLNFAEVSGVRAMIETYPLEKAAEAYARMLSGKAEFRVVLTM
jgi:D-arabinose 1-dehydrogenase-like Zn-dependent alcohol dehydrogenase/enamine deaminase RidA (YjgF/YER057c/UK114 family)